MSRSNSDVNRASKLAGLRRQAGSVEQSAADPSLRKTGIRVMSEMPWGTHICVFYETKEDLLDIAKQRILCLGDLQSDHGN